jgi:transposase
VRMFCGIDWAEDHHDVALINTDGKLIAKQRISDDAAGFAALMHLLAEAGDSADDTIPVAIETSRGLLVACLRATGRKVFAINPMAVSRYRDRHSVAGKKSDAGDALVLAHILRTDLAAHGHCPPTPNSPRQSPCWPAPSKTRSGNAPARTTSSARCCVSTTRASWLRSPTSATGCCAQRPARCWPPHPPPPRGAALTKAQLRALLKRAGRQRGIQLEADRIQAALRTPQLRQLPQVEDAFGRQTLALLRLLDAACTNAEELATEATKHFEQHPDAEIITSLPGLGSLTGARVLAEIGDDRSRFANARALKAYAGAAPVTRASGKSLTVMHRRVKNQRLASVGYLWAFAALTASPGARAHYDRRKAAGDRHVAAQRNLFNRMIGILHHCLTTGTKYDEHTAFPAGEFTPTTAAA